jgi:TPR repeat protein
MIMQARLLTLVLFLCVAGITAGCLPIPLLPSGNIHSFEDDIEDLVDKAATKNEVLEKLGNPLKYSKTSMSYKACRETAGLGFIICLPYACDGGLIMGGNTECFELVLKFDAKSRLLSYQEIPWRETFDYAEEQMKLLLLADQGDNVARRLWEQSYTYRNKLISGSGATQVVGPATEGDADAQLQLYWQGLAIDVGLKWLCRAADQGHREARTQLGNLYYYGSQKFYQLANIQIKPDSPKSCMWLHLAGRVDIREKPEAKDNQDTLPSYDSAEVERTAKVMTPDELEGAKQLIQDWEPGQCDHDLYQYLGEEYVMGSGIEGLCIAAERDSMSAREALGRIYYFGSNDVEPDLPRAYMWYYLAADVYVRPSIAKSVMQLSCNDMTLEQRSIAIRLLEEWRPGKCEQDLLQNVPVFLKTVCGSSR